MFMEKNLESLSHDIGTCLSLSTDPFMCKMFSDLVENKGDRRTLTQKSITFKFQGQLQSLINMLKMSDSHFIRCVKSNDQCKPMTFDPCLVHRQLVYLGIFEVVKIQQSGLPCRMSHHKFNERFKQLLTSQNRWENLTIQKFLSLLRGNTKLPLDSAQIGKTLLFCKGPDLRALETRKLQVETKSAIMIQKWLRCWVNRQAYSILLLGISNMNQAVITVNKVGAMQAYGIIMSASSMYNNICGDNGILDHKVAEIEASLQLMDDRIALVNAASTLLKPKDQNDYESIGLVLMEAERLNILENSNIKTCIQLY